MDATMNATKKKSKIALPPVALNNKAMFDVIDKGGDIVKTDPVAVPVDTAPEDVLKSFTFKIYESELAQIREIIARMPKRDRISIHDFVITSVKDKINKERKKATE
jgi:hypothetical protein